MKMKKIILLLFFSLIYSHSFAQKTFFYKINTSQITNKSITKIYVEYEIAGLKFKDDLKFIDNKFTITKILTQPVAATIYTNSNTIKPIPVMLANNTLQLVLSDESIEIKKDGLQNDFLNLTKNDRIRPTYFPLYGELSAKNDTDGLKKLGVVFDSLKNDDIQKSLKYFKANKTSLLSLFAFNRYTTFFADYSKVENDFNQLPDWAKKSPDGQSIIAKINGAKSAQVGTLAKNFNQESSSGTVINLESYKGNIVLLDFWASWCAPCRKEHPNLIKIYDQFKDKKFTILSISLDSEKENWLTAISKDKLTWTQISDLKGQQNDIAIQYGVQSVPANFLIDSKGIIIGKNLTTEELKEKLVEIVEK
jgi:peroxiredoxin